MAETRMGLTAARADGTDSKTTNGQDSIEKLQ